MVLDLKDPQIRQDIKEIVIEALEERETKRLNQRLKENLASFETCKASIFYLDEPIKKGKE
jgi:hypothetical protein